jgi:cystathionine beta-lyase family protein involved in aluminum resistance
MFGVTRSVDLTAQQIEVIEAALHTQEKILSVQNRAGADMSTRARLNELKSVLKTLRRQTPAACAQPNHWTCKARALFG